MFLVGQPDFRDTMARADMEQLRQRVIATYHLDPISRQETERYIEHRLSCVGWDGDPKFTPDAYDVIHAATGGLPRKIHKLCNRALLYCSVEGKHVAAAEDINAVLADMSAELATIPVAEREAERQDFDVNAALEAAKRVVEAEPAPAIAPEAAPDKTKPAFRVFTVRPIHVESTVDLHAVSASDIKAGKQRAEPAVASAPSVTLTAASPVDGSDAAPTPGSVFDRLRARKKPVQKKAVEPVEATPPPPRPATLDDVANAIAAARPTRKATPAEDAAPALIEAAPTLNESEAEMPPLVEGEGWKQSVVFSINDTREELRRAHQSVTRLRRQLTEIDKRRHQRRVKISASLDRAESLLAEFQNAWR